MDNLKPARASFWRRAAAALIDLALQIPALYLVEYTLYSAWVSTFGGDWRGTQNWPWMFIGSSLLLLAVYAAGFESSARGATPGKMVFQMAVRGPHGQISFVRGLARFFARLLSTAVLGIGFLLAFGKERKTLHDRITDTQVVRL